MPGQEQGGAPLGKSQPFLVEKYGCLPRALRTAGIVLFLDNGGGAGGLAAVFWSQNHRYAGHTSGRVSGNLPWGRRKLERKATDSGYLLILPGLPGAQRWPRPAQVRRGSRALCVKVHVVWDFQPPAPVLQIQWTKPRSWLSRRQESAEPAGVPTVGLPRVTPLLPSVPV